MLRMISRETTEKIDEKLFNSLFQERINTRSFAWAHSQRNGRKASALLHIVSCSAQSERVRGNRHRLSFCSAKVQDATDNEGESFVGIEIGRLNHSRSQGSAGCWCSAGCTKNSTTALPSNVGTIITDRGIIAEMSISLWIGSRNQYTLVSRRQVAACLAFSTCLECTRESFDHRENYISIVLPVEVRTGCHLFEVWMRPWCSELIKK